MTVACCSHTGCLLLVAEHNNHRMAVWICYRGADGVWVGTGVGNIEGTGEGTG
jgi:hypothetical protein